MANIFYMFDHLFTNMSNTVTFVTNMTNRNLSDSGT